MSPVASDSFVTSDFADTFATLDANPGILTVPNEASRPSNFTAAQHGRMIWQSDHNILWIWNQPTTGTVGAWQRVGSSGFLARFASTGTVSTVTTDRNLGPTVCSGTVVIPGGRPYLVMFKWDVASSQGSRIITRYWENDVPILDQVFNDVLYPTVPGTAPSAKAFYYWRPAPLTALTMRCKLSISSFNDAHPWGSGLTTMTGGIMHIIEV